MATLLLSAAGTAVGGLFGPVGAALGRAVGAAAGYAIDRSLFGGQQSVEVGRLGDLDVQTSREGAAIPKVYGRVRIAGQVIWATRLVEEVTEEEAGGKGGSSGTSVERYRYFANFAVGLCEGKISRIGRVWADGQPFNMVGATYRIHKGGSGQDRDSLIEAKQGTNKTPAYRDTAYIVFERLPLAKFGNRIPLMSFEVMRAVGDLEPTVRAVTMIPGATEYAYATSPVKEIRNPGHKVALTRHTDRERTDWAASIGELQDLCPNLKSVGLVASWFGDDLRANHCEIKPAVTSRTIETTVDWEAAGLNRSTALLVSTHDGKPAYGGTPSDASVIDALRDIADRGLKALFIPFIMMDVPAGNGLTDPHGGSAQGAYPWRGMITLSKAPGQPGSPDKTGTAADQVAAFVGTAAADDFAISNDRVIYSGPEEWSFRRLILHYAWLCKAAGGVDAFLLGSELRGLTTVRSSASQYPFVDALVDLAADVRDILGGSVRLSYGADWTEYFGHQPTDGSGDVHFHLDPLWSSNKIDAVAIDNYMPLADWRDGSDHLDATLWDNGRSVAYLRSNIASGEGFDWYYASDADRDNQVRTAITDGAHGKPWVFRYKDLKNWWGNQHFNRPGGVEAASPTDWVPESKPIWFTELGCPAVDKGPNQPNVFPDPKSSASAQPYYSSGVRDDLVQRRSLEATVRHFDPSDPDYVSDSNPYTSVYGGRMVEQDMTHLWTWDARPYPAFPYLESVWSDGENWEAGHWLTGRFGAAPGKELVEAILEDFGVTDADVDELDGLIDGYLIDRPISARQALEPLSNLLMFEGFEGASRLRFVRRARKAMTVIGEGALVPEDGRPAITVRRAQQSELPAVMTLAFDDPLTDFRATGISARQPSAAGNNTVTLQTSAAISYATAIGMVEAMLQDAWASAEVHEFALTPKNLALEPGDVCDIAVGEGSRTILINRLEDALARRVEGRGIDPDILSIRPGSRRVQLPSETGDVSAPEVLFLDLPLLTGEEAPDAPRVAVSLVPWAGPISLSLGTAESGFTARQAIEQRATMGELAAPLGTGPVHRWDRANTIFVTLYAGALASLPESGVLNGGNVAAIGDAETGFEVVQFQSATMVDETTWELSGLLRGQAGTADVMLAGHPAGARFVLLNSAVESLDLYGAETTLGLTARAGLAGEVYDPETFTDIDVPVARRGLSCLPPVHVNGRRDGPEGDITLSWIRQTRIDGDPWEPVEVPLGEAGEAYQVEILDAGEVVRTLNIASPVATYTEAHQTEDFGGLPESIALRVAQVSATEGPGLATETMINV